MLQPKALYKYMSRASRVFVLQHLACTVLYNLPDTTESRQPPPPPSPSMHEFIHSSYGRGKYNVDTARSTVEDGADETIGGARAGGLR